MLLRDYASIYVARRDGSPGYLDQLRWSITALEHHTGRSLDLADLTEPLINAYLLATRDRLAPATRHSRRNMILRLWRHAAIDPLLSRRPRPPEPAAVARVRLRQTPPSAWTVDQVRSLLEAAGRLSGTYGGRFSKSGYWRSYILAGWDLGWRGCDLRSLPIAAVAPRLAIVQQKTQRPVFGRLRPAALAAIADFVGGDERELVWPLWCKISTWRLIARRLVSRCDLPGSIGWLRSSAATACEIEHPGRGYQFLGNTPTVFYRHYFDQSQTEPPQPPAL